MANEPTADLTHSTSTHSAHLDALTNDALNALLSADWKTATELAQQLTASFPDFSLGHLLLAELHAVSAASETLLTNSSSYSKSLIDLLLEARARALQIDSNADNPATSDQRLPADIIQLGKHIDHVVLVDLDSSMLYLFDNTGSQPQLAKKHYISSGKGGFGKQVEGDLKTPLGVYRIHGFRSDDSLPPLYGSGALMLDYPNALDRALGKSGSGIWLHGNPRSNRSRSPRSSEGCVTMANDHLLDLYQQIDLSRTSVILGNTVQWLDPAETLVRRDRFRELFDQYRRAWVNNDIIDLQAIYTPDALPSNIKYANSARTQKVGANSAQKLKLLSPVGINLDTLDAMPIDELSLLMNPSANDANTNQHLVMSFVLEGGTPANVTLYWERNSAGFWRIKREDINAGGA